MQPPMSTLSATLFPYTTLFRSRAVDGKSGSLLARDVDGGLADGKVVGTRQGGWNAEQRRDHPDGRIGRQGVAGRPAVEGIRPSRSEEHTSELQSLMRISYAVFCLKKKNSSTQN